MTALFVAAVSCAFAWETVSGSGAAQGHTITMNHEISFRHADPRLHTNYKDNAAALKDFSGIAANIDGKDYKITINCQASPEGSYDYNMKLAQGRGESLRNWILKNHPSLVGRIVIQNNGESWGELRKMIASDEHFTPERRQQIIGWLFDPSVSLDIRKSRMLRLPEYSYMRDTYFPVLRSSAVCNITFIPDSSPVTEDVVTAPEPEPEPERDTLVPAPAPVIPMMAAAFVPEVASPDFIDTPAKEEQPRKSPIFFAVNNNLLMDALLVVNVGFELGFCDHWSVNVPLSYSPYTVTNNWRYRLFTVQPEVRYWFKEPGSGHSIGIHGHVAYYNISSLVDTKNRYQDRNGHHPLYGGGLDYTYGLRLGRNHDSSWGVEFSAGVGYARLDYDVFYNVDNGVIHDSRERNYWGPTRLAVCFYYNFCGRNRKK